MEPRLHFYGAAGTVTGSCIRLETGPASVLVDCGLFQGSKSLKALNYQPFPFDPGGLDAVLLTHAHIDHSGLLPALLNAGCRAPVLATGPTRDLLGCMLPDCGHIQEYEVEILNRRRVQRGGQPVAPIYTAADGARAARHVTPVAYGSWRPVARGVRARFWDAGHMLGSASLELEVERAGGTLRLLFSGDLGNGDKAFHEPPEAPRDLDVLVVESTYGDRVRAHLTSAERRDRLGEEVAAALARGGNVVMPVFAVERAQEILFDLGRLRAAGRLPACQVFLDSPLAIEATRIFERYAGSLGEVAGDRAALLPPNLHLVETVEASKHLNRIHSGAVILAASGMCDAGRVRHHLRHNLWREECTVLMVGYQASGTLGRVLLDGVDQVRIFGDAVQVRARIRLLDVYSAHPDRDALVAWTAARQPIRRAVVLGHGEPPALEGLRDALAPRLPDGPEILIPTLGSCLHLGERPVLSPGRPRLADPAAVAADWHNRYAALRLRLDAALRDEADPRRRDALLERLEALVEGRASGRR